MDTALVWGAREGRGLARPFKQTELPRAMRVPKLVRVLLGGAGIAGALAGAIDRRPSWPRRAFRGICVGSTLAYFITVTADLLEHLRLEKELTGHALRWVAIPPSETAVHTAILVTNLSALALARQPQKPLKLRDVWVLAAPAVFLALGWADELIYHRRRAPHREDLIHTTEHLAEGMMWTSLYATRLVRWGR